MNDQPQQMSPEDQDLARQAGEAEHAALSEAMTSYLQGRVVALGLEVRRRDRRITELETEVARLTAPDAGEAPPES